MKQEQIKIIITRSGQVGTYYIDDNITITNGQIIEALIKFIKGKSQSGLHNLRLGSSIWNPNYLRSKMKWRN